MDYFTPNHSQGQLPNQQGQQPNNNQARGQMQPPSSIQIPVTAGSNMMDGQAMVNGNSLDDMVRENENAILRRRSMPQQPFSDEGSEVAPRRMSTAGTGDMLNFGGNDAIRNYQFNQQTTPLSALDTANIGLPDTLPGSMSDYMADPSDYSNLSPDMMGSMIPSTFANMNMGPIPGESHNVNMFSGSMGGSYASGQLGGLRQDFTLDMNGDGQFMTPPNITSGVMSESGDIMMPVSQSLNTMDHTNQQVNMSLDPQLGDFGNNTGLSHNVSSTGSIISPEQGTSSTGITHSNSSSDMATSAVAAPAAPPGMRKNTYSKSGFDMMKALWLVSTRKDPKVHLGAVDLSCAFVVCDVTMNDCPIVYVSDNFQNLTGYSRHEIVGQNCRFLQAPNGKVQAGVKREFVDDKAVYNLKRTIQEGCEVQQSLINYRKGGKPFLNLLTMIPIPWDSTEIKYIIGFQIDLVECPDAITSNQERGGLKINYKHSDIGQYIWQPPSLAQMEHENGQTLGLDDVSTLLQQFNPSGLVSDWHKQSWDKMLLENTDDMIHVLSLKGLFLYLSPACKRILEYDPNELLGNALSTVCHPSDIVPVTRELKDAPPEARLISYIESAGRTVDIPGLRAMGLWWSSKAKAASVLFWWAARDLSLL
uniref:PAS domain-containing protein n=1 Tax=Bionectria ochroleuca TaxID=29856 RepID=A0A8H7K7C6_BIOOC